MQVCWGRFGVVLGSIWGRFGVDAWGRFGVVLGSFWGHLGVVLGSFWGRGRFGVVLGSFRGRFGVVLGSFRGRFGVVLGSTSGLTVGSALHAQIFGSLWFGQAGPGSATRASMWLSLGLVEMTGAMATIALVSSSASSNVFLLPVFGCSGWLTSPLEVYYCTRVFYIKCLKITEASKDSEVLESPKHISKSGTKNPQVLVTPKKS